MARAEDTVNNVGAMPESESQSPPEAEGGDPSEIKAHIDKTREEMDRTLGALGEMLKPRRLVDEFLGLFRSGEGQIQAGHLAKRAGRKTLKTVKEHPVPAALVGAGVAYLLFLEGKSGAVRRAVTQSGEETRDKLSSVAEKVRQRSGDMADEVRAQASGAFQEAGVEVSELAGSTSDRVCGVGEGQESGSSGVVQGTKGKASGTAARIRESARRVGSIASGTAHRMRDAAMGVSSRAGHAAQSVRANASQAGRKIREKAANARCQVRRGYDQTRNKVVEASDDHPLAVGAGLLGLGLLVGLAIPRGRTETRFLAGKGDKLWGRAKTKGKEMFDRGARVARATAEQSIEEAKRQGLTPSGLIDRAKHVAADLKEAARREELTPEQLGEKAGAVAGQAMDTARHEFQQQSNLEQPTAPRM